jgi:hypothetical protein
MKKKDKNGMVQLESIRDEINRQTIQTKTHIYIYQHIVCTYKSNQTNSMKQINYKFQPKQRSIRYTYPYQSYMIFPINCTIHIFCKP